LQDELQGFIEEYVEVFDHSLFECKNLKIKI